MPHNKHGSKWIRKDLRAAIYLRWDNRCFWCWKIHGAETLDHLIPKDYGSARPHHLVPACRECNEKRGTKSVAAWMSFLASGGVQYTCTPEEKARNIEIFLARLEIRLKPYTRAERLAALNDGIPF